MTAPARLLARSAMDWVTTRKRDHDHRYLGYVARWRAAWRHRHLPWSGVTLDELRRRRPSDTLFVIGSGPSILRLSPEQWKAVGRHGSFGINFSILLDVAPTYQIVEDGKLDWLRDLQRRVLAPRRRALRDTVWFVSAKQPWRGLHPRYAPEMFPEHPTVCVYPVPRSIRLDRDRPFETRDFARSLVYRGTMSVTIDLGWRLGYTRIVLLGVDLGTVEHFFDDRPEMRQVVEVHHQAAEAMRPGAKVLHQMVPAGNKYRPQDEYYAAVRTLGLAPRGVELLVGNPDNALCPRVPALDWETV